MRCTAKRSDGTPCKSWAIKGGNVCNTHGGAAPQVKASEAERLRALQPKCVDVYERALDQREDLPSAIRAADSVAKHTSLGDGNAAMVQALDPGRRQIPNELLAALISALENAGS